MKNIVKKLRKGFTIVELVIVIAIIAILAAVLIPTLANVIDQAEESNDIQTVSQLNTIASAYATVGEIETVNDALDGALENGYSVSALTPTSEGNVIVYDATSNRFALLSKDLTTVVYKDSATAKEDAEDWQTSTTWVIVTTSDVTLENNVYTLTGSNSYVLVGDDWNGASVTAEYGVSLYDYKGTTKLGSLVIENKDDENSQQTIKAEDSTNSKSTVAKTTTANNTKVSSITVNVKAAYLSCSANVYTIKNYSTTTITAVVGNSQLAEYGTTSIYDASQIGSSGKITNYNKNISEDVIVKVAEGKKAEDVLVDNTKTITVSAVATTTVTITVTTTSSTTVSITVDGSEIVSTDTTDGTTTITADLSGTSLKPYEISKASDLLDLESGCYKLVADVTAISSVRITSDTEIILDLNGYSLSYESDSSAVITVVSGAKLTVKDSGTDGSISGKWAILNSGETIIDGGILNSTNFVQNGSDATMTVNGGTISGAYGFLNYGSLVITGGTISGTNYGIYNYSTSSVAISGGTLSATGDKAIAVRSVLGTLDISGGTISAYQAVNAYGTTVTISGGTLTATYLGVLLGSCSVNDSSVYATLTMTNGNISGATYGVYSTGEITVSGGNIYGANRAIQSNGTTTITGGTFGSYTDTNNNEYESSYGIMVFNGTTTITGGTVTAIYAAVYATGSATNVTIGGNAVIKGEGSLSNSSVAGIVMWNSCTVTINDNAQISAENKDESSNGSGAILVYGPGAVSEGTQTYTTLVVNGGTITGDSFGIAGNGSQGSSSDYRYTDITINGGTITGSWGIYHPQDGKLTITGGTITGEETGIEIRSGSLTITGGYIKAIAVPESIEPNGSGTTVIGVAVAVSQHTTQNAITVDISGGTLEGYFALYETDTVSTDILSENVTITISGTAVLTTTKSDVTKDYYSENDKVTDNRTATSD